MNAVEISQEASPEAWDRYVEQHPEGTPDHLWHWRDIFRGVFRHDCAYLLARRGSVISGVLPLVRFRSPLLGRSLVSLPFMNYGGVLA